MKRIFLCIFALWIAQVDAGQLKITELKFHHYGQLGKVIIKLNGSLHKAPELIVKKNILQVSLPNVIVWPSIKKRVSVRKSLDSELKAYQFDQNTVRVRTILPFAVKGMEEQVNLILKDHSVELYFPRISQRSLAKVTKKVPGAKADTRLPSLVAGGSALRSSSGEALKGGQLLVKSKLKKKPQEYDEEYLDYLLQKKAESKPSVVREEIKPGNMLQDEVKTTQSSIEKKNDTIIEEKSFDVMTYIGKYIAFLGLILVGVYGLVLLFKKGVLKKGRLGFLNDTGLVSVLSTTYLAPKRSLLVVKIHHQVLLLGNSEAGLTYLSELKDVSDLLKEGEKKVAGGNFDTTIHALKKDEVASQIKLKENPFDGQSSSGQKEDVKKKKSSLSEQIKRKVKDLRPLQ